jgi:hypothetical protein
MGLEKDLPRGEQLLALLRPFIKHLALSNLSPKTIRRHVDNLWLLGGEIIRDLHYDPALRKRAPERLLCSVIHEAGGPLRHNGSEEEQRSFDATCRKLCRLLPQSQRSPGSYLQIPRTRPSMRQSDTLSTPGTLIPRHYFWHLACLKTLLCS